MCDFPFSDERSDLTEDLEGVPGVTVSQLEEAPHPPKPCCRALFQLLHAAAAWEAWRHVIPNWRQLSVSCPCQRWVGASTSCRCSQMFSGSQHFATHSHGGNSWQVNVDGLELPVLSHDTATGTATHDESALSRRIFCAQKRHFMAFLLYIYINNIMMHIHIYIYTIYVLAKLSSVSEVCGLWLQMALCEHSCDPNCCLVHETLLHGMGCMGHLEHCKTQRFFGGTWWNMKNRGRK